MPTGDDGPCVLTKSGASCCHVGAVQEQAETLGISWSTVKQAAADSQNVQIQPAAVAPASKMQWWSRDIASGTIHAYRYRAFKGDT